MRGTESWISLKRRAPQNRPRSTSGVQRSAMTSAASAMGQNCPYPFGAVVFDWTMGKRLGPDRGDCNFTYCS